MNILFITADQWRGDSTGYAGHKLVKTPNLDALAADSVAFLNHYSQAAPCSPSRACLYTGLYQMNNRVCRNGSPLSDRFDNLARAARRVGYDPTLFGYTDQSPDPAVHAPNDPELTTYEGILPGFSVRVKMQDHRKPWLAWLRDRGLDFDNEAEAHLPVGAAPDDFTNAPPGYDKDQTETAFVAGEFIRWLGERQGEKRPWFAHVSFIRPHPPFIVPAPYNTMVDPAEVDGFARAATPGAEGEQHPLLDYLLNHAGAKSFVPGATGLVRDLDEHAFRQIKATYYGMISEVDAQLGRLFDAVKATGAWDDTLIVFTSDHGEMLGDHYGLGKGGYFDGSQHVPLIVRDPKGSARGVRVETFTEAVDVMPTILERLGVAPQNHVDGHSLTEYLDGGAPAEPREEVHWEFDFREVATQRAENWFGLPSTKLSMAAIRSDKWKYVHFAGLPPLLFDLENDPGNLTNLADDPAFAGVRLEMAEKLLSWRAEHLDQTLALKQLTADGVVTAPALR
ncbi:MAG TPA: alkaline phosphatase family protein [Devosia sp.]|nr:alkaline phosphatase family protein [Devosia sp.]